MKEKVQSSTDRPKLRLFAPSESKENHKPAQDDRKDGRGQKRKSDDVLSPRSTRRSSNSKTKGLTLIQEFDEIIRSAQTVGSPPRRTSKPSSVFKKVNTQSQKLDPVVMLCKLPTEKEDCKSPERPSSSKITTDDSAPSPATPPMPKKLPLLIEQQDDAPSPQGMSLDKADGNESFHFVTQDNFMKEEGPNDDEEPPFLDAVDTSLNASGLDLDNLIDEIFTKNSIPSDQEISNHEHLIAHSSLDFPLGNDIHDHPNQNKEDHIEKESEEELVVPHSGEGDLNTKSQCIEKAAELILPTSDCDKNSVVLSQACPLISGEPNAASNTANESNNAMEMVQDTSCTKIHESQDRLMDSPANVLNHIEQDNNDMSSIQKADELQKNLLVTSENATLDQTEADSLDETSAKNIGNEEEFCEDLSLSHSQFLDIDAKCGLLQEDTTVNQSEEPMLANISGVVSLQQKPPTHSYPGFIIPPAPSMEWVQKTMESRRRLQMITQEISRLK